MNRHELFEELDAFDPQWQKNYRSVISAAQAAGASAILKEWLRTHQGETYLSHIHATRDYLKEIEEYKALIAEEESKLPFGYHNLGSVKGEYFG